MFVMTHEIKIDGKIIPLITAVSVKMDVTQLANTATIELPATAFKRRLAQVADIRRGQRWRSGLATMTATSWSLADT